MTKTSTPEEPRPDAESEAIICEKGALFRLRSAMGARTTHDVLWQERRLIYPGWQRVYQGAVLLAAVANLWLLSHVLRALNTLVAMEAAR